MKPKVVYLLLLCLFITSALHAQKVPLPTDIGAKIMFGNYGYTNGVDTLRFTNGLEAFFSKYVTSRLSIGMPLRIGVSHLPEAQNNVSTIGVDGRLQFHLADYDAKFAPYIHAGGGIVLENFDTSNIQIPAGVGFNIQLAPNSFLTLHAEYRYGLTQALRNNIQVGVGYTYRLGRTKMDQDGDGVPDELDQCPEEIGTKELAGCPDRDGDGITDIADACPDWPGTESMLGCPDRDGDGITDAQDECPDEAGLNATKGCPDADADGVADSMDDCPDSEGTVDENGCPVEMIVEVEVEDIDSDGDGIVDSEDDCPEVAGVRSGSGCPDTDGDTLPDSMDDCPNEAGLIKNNGCPETKSTNIISKTDSDEDGVPDAEDACPNESGSEYAQGCPDMDGDGIADRVDNCPNEAGTVAANGCPEIATPQPLKDSDGDGVPDAEDYCPNEAGTKNNDGCPEASTTTFDHSTTTQDVPELNTPESVDATPSNENTYPVTAEEQAFLTDVAQNIEFETASPVLKSTSYELLNQVADILNRYPNANLRIEGHTDDVGRTAANQLLSEQRATACREYLLTRAVNRTRMDAVGYGELRPIASNATPSGRQQNRRVEFKLYE
jgi:outer membrane protein OmpA-like peptidoglycan-associated protein